MQVNYQIGDSFKELYHLWQGFHDVNVSSFRPFTGDENKKSFCMRVYYAKKKKELVFREVRFFKVEGNLLEFTSFDAFKWNKDVYISSILNVEMTFFNDNIVPARYAGRIQLICESISIRK